MLFLAAVFCLFVWIVSVGWDNILASCVAGLSLITFTLIGLLFGGAFWFDASIHHLEHQEYAPKADSFLVASSNAILYWGEIDGPILSYAKETATFVWKHESPTMPKQIVVLEAKGSVWAAETYREIRDSLEKLPPEELTRQPSDTPKTDPLLHIGDGIHPDFRYTDILIRGLLFWPAVRVKWVGPVYEGRFSIKEHIKESG
jgi:hypothetical protein